MVYYPKYERNLQKATAIAEIAKMGVDMARRMVTRCLTKAAKAGVAMSLSIL